MQVTVGGSWNSKGPPESWTKADVSISDDEYQEMVEWSPAKKFCALCQIAEGYIALHREDTAAVLDAKAKYPFAFKL